MHSVLSLLHVKALHYPFVTMGSSGHSHTQGIVRHEGALANLISAPMDPT